MEQNNRKLSKKLICFILSILILTVVVTYIKGSCFGKNLDLQKHNVFIKGPDMNIYHKGPAVLLNDGNVLVIGGETNETEIYNNKNNKFEPAGKLNFIRDFGATATLLKDGNILITGGGVRNPNPKFGIFVNYNINIPKQAEIYDKNSKQFIIMSEMNIPRITHTAILADNGNVLFFGGYDENIKSVTQIEEYNVKTKRFKILSEFNNKNYIYGVVGKEPDNKFIIIGFPVNYNQDFNNLKYKIFIYDYTSDKIQEFKEQNKIINNTKIYSSNFCINSPIMDKRKNVGIIVSKNDKEIVKISVVDNEKENYTVSNINDEKALLVGGDKFGWLSNVYDSTEFLDINNVKFIPQKAKLNNKRYSHMAVQLPEDKIIVIGGYSDAYSQSKLLSSEIYYK